MFDTPHLDPDDPEDGGRHDDVVTDGNDYGCEVCCDPRGCAECRPGGVFHPTYDRDGAHLGNLYAWDGTGPHPFRHAYLDPTAPF